MTHETFDLIHADPLSSFDPFWDPNTFLLPEHLATRDEWISWTSHPHIRALVDGAVSTVVALRVERVRDTVVEDLFSPLVQSNEADAAATS